MKTAQLTELVYQALETEIGGVEVYTAALKCAQNDNLKEEWERYLEQTRHHVEVCEEMCAELGLDPAQETNGRKVCRLKAEALVQAIQTAIDGGDMDAAQIVAAECVVDAETKDHSNWELIGEAAKKASAETAKALQKAFDEVEDEEDEHLYHTMGYVRELWIQSLGMPAVLPPPEEAKHVRSAIGAARAKQARSQLL
jgi:rubrerythrin